MSMRTSRGWSRGARLSGFTALAAAGVALGGCSAGDNGEEDVTLTFLNTMADGAFDEVIAQFEADNPGIKVDSQGLPFNDLTEQIQARLSTKDDSIDVLFVDPPRLPAMVNQGFLMDISGEKDKIAAEVQPSSMKSATYNDKLWSVPFFTSSSFLFYNKDLLDAAGQDYPSADPADRLTWEELVTLATDAQSAGAAYGFAFDQVDRPFQLLPLFESSGAGSGLGGDGLSIEITSPAWVNTAQWYADLFTSGLSQRGVSATESPSQFIAGQVAYFVGGSARMKSFNEAADLNYGIAPHPMFAGGTAVTPTGSWTIGVSAFSKHQEAALKFAEYLSLDAEAADTVSATTSFPPVNNEAFPKYLARIEADADGRAAGFADLFQYESDNTAVPRPSSIGYVDYETRLEAAFSDIRNGQDVAETLQRAADDLESTFARLK